MRPTPIDDELAAAVPGVRKVIGPPKDDLFSVVAPVEAMVTREGRSWMYSMRLVLEEGDLEHLQAGGALWLTMASRVVPFRMEMGL